MERGGLAQWLGLRGEQGMKKIIAGFAACIFIALISAGYLLACAFSKSPETHEQDTK